MSTFTVTENPIQVYLGDQPQVTLVNDGPYSIYFDMIPGANSVNGFELPPTGQMTWKASQPLWASTKTIEGQSNSARLRTAIAGELSLTTRARFVKEVYSQPCSVLTSGVTPYLETGHLNTLYIRRQYNASVAVEWAETYSLSWYDENLSLVMVERGTLAGNLSDYDTIMTWRLRVPVKGKYVKITTVGLGFTGSGNGLLSVFGTDIEGQWSQTLITPTTPAGALLTGMQQIGSYKITGWVTDNRWGVPFLDTQMRVHFRNVGVGAAFIGMFDTLAESFPFDFVSVPAGNSVVYNYFGNPRQTYWFGSYTGGTTNMTAAITWPYYK